VKIIKLIDSEAATVSPSRFPSYTRCDLAAVCPGPRPSARSAGDPPAHTRATLPHITFDLLQDVSGPSVRQTRQFFRVGRVSQRRSLGRLLVPTHARPHT